MATIALLNQKGGVGKTSTCHHLAGTLSLLGRRVLLVDADPQASLTQGLLGPMAMRQLDPATTIAGVLAGDEPFAEAVIRTSHIPGVDLVPGSKRATRFNVPEPHLADPSLQVSLRDFLDEVRADYDVVLVDCPPNLHACSWCALVASDFLIVPLTPEDYASQGIVDVQESVALVRGGANPRVRSLGYLLTKVNPRRSVHKLYEESLRSLYGDEVFQTRVVEAVEYIEALNQRLPVAQFRPKGAAAKVMKALAEEMLDRIQRVSAARAGEAA
jgi:chromosome partitioning protein